VATKTVSVSVAGSGNNTLVTGVAGHLYKVTSYALVANGTVGVKFISGSTDISGVMPLIVNSGVSATGSREDPLLETLPGDNLIINLSAAVAVTGHLSYVDAVS